MVMPMSPKVKIIVIVPVLNPHASVVETRRNDRAEYDQVESVQKHSDPTPLVGVRYRFGSSSPDRYMFALQTPVHNEHIDCVRSHNAVSNVAVISRNGTLRK